MEDNIETWLKLADTAIEQAQLLTMEQAVCLQNREAYTPPETTLRQNHLEAKIDRSLLGHLDTSLLVMSIDQDRRPEDVLEGLLILRAVRFYLYGEILPKPFE